MCRVTAYLGPEIRLSALLSEPDNGLARQFSPQQHAMLNLAGFGMLGWNDDGQDPLHYRSTTIPIYDTNLDSLSRKVSASTLLAHVRGIPFAPGPGYGPQNLHPFRFPIASIALAHNGVVSDFERLRISLLHRICPKVAAHIQGTTDSEYVYALFLSQLEDPSATPDVDEILEALSATVRVLLQVRAEISATSQSSLNLVLCNRDLLVGARLMLDYGRYPLEEPCAADTYAPFLGLWYTGGHTYQAGVRGWRMGGDATESRAVILSSEPLTRNTTGWVEVPEYNALVARRVRGHVDLSLHEVPY
jgi:glutamine amidotransferase